MVNLAKGKKKRKKTNTEGSHLETSTAVLETPQTSVLSVETEKMEEPEEDEQEESNKDIAILVLDDASRNVIKSNISTIGLTGIQFIDSLDELSDNLVQYSRNVIILEGFFQRPTCLSELKLFKEIYRLNYFYLGSSKYFKIITKLATCFECDLASLDHQTIIAALYGDSTQEIHNSTDYFDKGYYVDKILAEEDNYPIEAVETANAYKSIENILKSVILEKEVAKEEVINLQNENAKLQSDAERLLKGYRSLIGEAQSLNKTLERYEQIFTNDIYEKVRLADYVNKPLIIYLKEFEDFINLDEFLETLFSVFKLQDRKSTKVLRLFDSATSRKMLTVPEYYTVLTNKYLLSDVIEYDFICKTGDYRKVLDKILMNEVGLNILIIIDSKSLDDVVVSGTAIHLNLCREEEHLSAFGLNKGNTIVNSGDVDSDFYWGRYNTEGMSNREKMIYLSSRPVIRNVLELSRMFAQSL